PALPAVALLVGERITCLVRARRGTKVLMLTGLLLIVLAGGAGWYLIRVSHLSPRCALIVGLPLASTGLIALIYPRARQTVFALVGVSVLVTSIIALEWAAPALSRKESVRDLLSAAAARGYGQAPVLQLHTVERTAEFYAAGRLAYRSDGEPVKLEGAMQVIDEARKRNGPVLCFVPLEYVSQLTSA